MVMNTCLQRRPILNPVVPQIVDITFNSEGSKRSRRRSLTTEQTADANKVGEEPCSSPVSQPDQGDDPHQFGDGSNSSLTPRDTSAVDWTVVPGATDFPTPRTETSIGTTTHPEFPVSPRLDPQVCAEQHPTSPGTSQEQGSPYANMAMRRPADSAARNSTISISPSSGAPADLDVVDLEVLNYLASYPSNLELLAASPRQPQSATANPELRVVAESVAESSSNSYLTCYTDAAYSGLHSQLHNHIVEATRDAALSSNKPPAMLPGQGAQNPQSPSVGQELLSKRATGPRPLRSTIITERRAVELWQNYLDEIAPWLDMFDNSKQWQTTVAHMAQRVECLHYSLLALSARQQEQRKPGRPHMESLHLYQEAIRLVAVQLSSLRTEIIAAVVLLCVLEMMSSSPRLWAKHLDGCAMLLEAAGINGVVGGLGEVLFWTFARMDVYRAFISDTVTNLPTIRWLYTTDSMSSAVSALKNRTGTDHYANYAVFLCAGAVNIISNQESTDSRQTFVSRWKALYDLLESWYDDRPQEMRPLMTIPQSGEDSQSSFDTILYSTPPAISGNHIYHVSMIVLLQDKPKEVRLPKSHKSMLWHARQICGISLSNRDHGALIHGLQPIWIAGRLMSHHSEHKAILDFLKRLEEETGWLTSWRIDDLKEFWGVCDDD